MKKRVLNVVPFILMFMVATGSVIFSCTTSTSVASGNKGTWTYVNTGKSEDGKIYTIQALSQVKNVIAINEFNHSQRIQLSKDSWTYDSSTTEIKVNKTLPFANTLLHVEGYISRPNSHILRGFKGEPEDLFIVINNRLALAQFDYKWEPSSGLLTLEKDFNPLTDSYVISYPTEKGNNTFTAGKLKMDDQFAYLQAQHNNLQTKRMNENQKTFYVLKKPASPEMKPEIENREPTAAEVEYLKNPPIFVFKNRYKISDAKISREVGFNVSTPINFKSDNEKFSSYYGKTILEENIDGKTQISVSQCYYAQSNPDQPSFMITIAKDYLNNELVSENNDFVISSEKLALEYPVEKKIIWSTRFISNTKPDVIQLLIYTWKDHQEYFSMETTPDKAKIAEKLISNIIEYR